MLRAVYDLQLQQTIRPGRVVCGMFSEGEMYIAAANMANKVIISKLPTLVTYASRIVPSKESLQVLNINQTITALAVGKFTRDSPTDLLFIGTPTELIVYDVPSNREVFRRPTTGGASSIAIGTTGRIKKTLAIVGGQSALQGFDQEGNEPLWTLTGDNVSVLCLFDINKDGQTEIVAGCDDHQIRVFRETEQIFSMSETDNVVSLAVLKDQSFVYGLSNGTVGVYEQYDRRWRVKSKSVPTALIGMDLNGNGEQEILCGWSNGKFEVRDRFTGNLMFKYQMDDPVAQVVEVHDPRANSYLLVCSTEGNVKAFAVENGAAGDSEVTFLQDVSSNEFISVDEQGESRINIFEEEDENEEATMQDRLDVRPKKGDFIMDAAYEWSTMQEDVEVIVEIEPSMNDPNYFTSSDSHRDGQKSLVPPGIQAFLRTDDVGDLKSLPNLFDKPCLKFTVRTTVSTYKIPGVIIFAEGVFAGESYYHHPPERLLSNVTQFPLSIPKNTPVEMFVTVMAGQPNRKYYFCHGQLIKIKRFAMYYQLTEQQPTQPEGYVTFKLLERTNRFLLWAADHFFLRTDHKSSTDPNKAVLSFVGLRDGEKLSLEMTGDGEVTVRTDSIDTAGDVVECIAESMSVKQLTSRAHFPKAYDTLKDVFVQVEEFQKNRQRQVADIADRGSTIRAMLMKAEETKMLEVWPEVRKCFLELGNQNKAVLGDFRVQMEAHEKLTTGLKLVSQLIDKAARLRVGSVKADLFAKCRMAVQNRDVGLLTRLMEFAGT
ncbi:hypothetical protein RvY_08295 [Ramazzottius varieornatus]|uniref:Bardet-Biedl syndrome 2 protein homolog n=1 Tax=Ramazzottius varieornatus TaxID=947166 RepID=A0A1D1VEK3_RAMVA|nr:hypothetical protein RvY_08295 [Ramazzottius varieornatus]